MNRTQEIWLVRHAEVEPIWKGICYGAMDVPLSRAGKDASDEMAEKLVQSLNPKIVYHSGLSRTRYLADRIASLGKSDIEVHEDARLQERNYGKWQGLTWDAAYNSDPDHFHDLVAKPDTYRPPSGETTTEMQLRIVQWLSEQDSTRAPMIAVSHSGPIAALAGELQELHATEWECCMTNHLEAVTLVPTANEPQRWQVKRKPENPNE